MFTVQDILRITGGVLVQGKGSVRLKGISTDSRTIKAKELFVAIKGERFDGHSYIPKMKERSAAAVLVSRKVQFPKNIPVILVKDTVKAYGLIARAHRDRFRIPVIAITGSAGKTTTKEMVAAVLSKRYKVLKNHATYNNHMGVPATLLNLKESHEIAVIECGTNQPGDIQWLARITNPSVVILTTIGESHLELLKSLQGVFNEKFELVKGMERPGAVIYNADDRYLRKIKSKKLRHRLIGYGIKERTDLVAKQISVDGKGNLHFSAGRQTFVLSSPIVHNIYTTLAAITCGRMFKISYNEIQDAIKRFKFPKGRGVVERIGSLQVIDDTYNANPVSFRSAIKTLSEVKTSGKRILVCGDMLELGSQSQALHRSIGRMAGESGIDFLLALGKFSQAICQEAKKNHKELQAHHCDSIEEVNRRLLGFCSPGDTILVKGSRGMRMERTIQFLKEKAPA